MAFPLGGAKSMRTKKAASDESALPELTDPDRKTRDSTDSSASKQRFNSDVPTNPSAITSPSTSGIFDVSVANTTNKPAGNLGAPLNALDSVEYSQNSSPSQSQHSKDALSPLMKLHESCTSSISEMNDSVPDLPCASDSLLWKNMQLKSSFSPNGFTESKKERNPPPTIPTSRIIVSLPTVEHRKWQQQRPCGSRNTMANFQSLPMHSNLPSVTLPTERTVSQVKKYTPKIKVEDLRKMGIRSREVETKFSKWATSLSEFATTPKVQEKEVEEHEQMFAEHMASISKTMDIMQSIEGIVDNHKKSIESRKSSQNQLYSTLLKKLGGYGPFASESSFSSSEPSEIHSARGTHSTEPQLLGHNLFTSTYSSKEHQLNNTKPIADNMLL